MLIQICKMKHNGDSVVDKIDGAKTMKDVDGTNVFASDGGAHTIGLILRPPSGISEAATASVDVRKKEAAGTPERTTLTRNVRKHLIHHTSCGCTPYP